MQKLGTFVEKSGVVLIPFENEMLALSDVKAGAKILGDAANQK